MRYLKLLVGILSVSASIPLAAQTRSSLEDLEARIVSTANENPGEYGIAALDLTTGQMIGVNTNTPYPMASTMKIVVAAAYLDDIDKGSRSLDDTIAGSSAYSLMDRMMVKSDNHATDLLIARLGGPSAIDDWLEAKNIQGIRVDRTIAQLLAARRNLWENEDTSTPQAMLTLLQRLDNGTLVSPSSRSIILDMMRRCSTGKNRIKGLMPTDAVVEHKTGTLNGYTSDVGYLTLSDGRRIAVAFFGLTTSRSAPF